MRGAMNRQQAFKILALSSAAFALQGCVAAVVPIAAGGLMGGSQIQGGRDDDEEVAVARAPAPAPTPTATPAPTPTPTPTPTPAPVEGTVIVERQSEPQMPPEPEPAPEPAMISSTAGTEVAAATEPVYGPADAPDETDPPAVIATQEVEEPAEAAPEEPVAVLVASLPDEPPAPPPVPDPVVVEPEPEPEPVMVAQSDPAPAEPAPAEPAPASSPPTRLAMNEVATPMEAVAPREAPTEAPAEAAAIVAPAPPPAAAAPEPRAAPKPSIPVSGAPVVATLFDPLVSYATSQEFQAGREGRESAMLADATSLNPTRADCASGPPTVLIDLDPDGERLALDGLLTAPSALGVKLAQMRAAGISIVWISGEPASNEAAIRMA